MKPDTVNAIPNLKNALPEFYYGIVKTWFENNIQTETSPNYRTVRQEILWGNKNIKFENNCLIYPAWIKDGIIFVNDIIDHHGNISQKIILNKLSIKTNWMSEFSRLIKSIPGNWKKILKSRDSIHSNVKTELKLYFKTNN